MNNLSFESSISTALINSQSSFEECQICNLANKSPKKSCNIEENLKYPNHRFRFNELIEAIKHLVGSYLDFSDLTCLATTHKAYQHLLKYNQSYSPYIVQKLRSAEVLTPEIMYLYKQASKTIELSSFFKNCHNLTHLVINFKNYECSEEFEFKSKEQVVIKEKKLFFSNRRILNKILTPNIKHLTINSECIGFDDLTIIASKCPNIEHLSLRGNMYIFGELKLIHIINHFKTLKFFGLAPISRLGRCINDNLSNKDISELIARGVHIKLLGLPS